MARIFVNGESFSQIAPTVLYELEFESIMRQHSPELFTGFEFVPFKVTVADESGSAKPDFALVDRGYRQWWVGETELGIHSLERHVLPQVRTLSRAYYGSDAANALLRESRGALEPRALEDLMKGAQPRVLVVVNSPCPTWPARLLRYDAQLCLIQVYRSEKNQHILLVDGYQPEVVVDRVSTCRLHPILANYLVVDAPAALGVLPGESLEIEFNGALSQWVRTDIHDAVWLVFHGKENPLSRGTHYVLIRTQDGDLRIAPYDPRRAP